jgi:hypothetical protein
MLIVVTYSHTQAHASFDSTKIIYSFLDLGGGGAVSVTILTVCVVLFGGKKPKVLEKMR